ncbi:VWA domain-containing protein [Sneathiella sp. P13V-1]|uniref:VWA domain-containing protein n=1 Tax=Sneathiella sp. P13V-1 TaxID=2697366 RepID=UPI00187B1413|nr:VWA domain-containing protein [Sneathiella sp. P13V-1]MBE7637295.1 VWA domain-containing protein [Sneathiella sp. P13V-1]
MSRPLAEFVDMLRHADVPVSIGEAIDAARTIELLGYEDRSLLKGALSQVMAKTEDEMASFDQCFDDFFKIETNLDLGGNLQEQLGDEGSDNGDGPEGSAPQDALDDLQNDMGPQNGEGGGSGGGSGQCEDQPSAEGQGTPSLIDMLESGDRTALTMAMNEAADEVGLGNIVLSTQRGLFTRRIMEAMGLNDVTQEVRDRRNQGEDESADELDRRLNILFEATRDMVDRQLALTAEGKSLEFRQDVLKKVRLSNIETRDFKIMRDLVRKMAKRLTDMNSRVKKVKNRGHLDIRKTMRRNVAYDGILFETHWKQKEKDRPKVMAVCDVSGSVASVARFLLLFLYSMNEVLPNVRSFAFSGDLGEITDLLKDNGPEEAVPAAIDKYGGRSTDYGRAMQDFKDLVFDEIDNRTTVIILGDGRSNGSDPGTDILKDIKKRAKRVIWLNPERKSLWGSGDSEMDRIAPYCTVADTCNSLNKLELVIRDLLKSN